MEFIEIIKTLMKEKNLKQADLCRLTNIPSSLMSDYVKGKKSPAIMNAISIADALHVSLDQLVGRTPLNDSSKKERTETFLEFSVAETIHIKKYRTLDEGGRQTVDAVLQIQYDIAVARQESTGLTAENERELEAYKQELLAAQKGQTSAALESTVKAASV